MNKPEQIKVHEIKHTFVSKSLLHFQLQYIYCKKNISDFSIHN